MTRPDVMISPTKWRQPIKANRKELHLWHVPRSVVRKLRLKDNTSQRLRIQFWDGHILPQSEFAITSGIEIAFDKASQEFVKPYIHKTRSSYFTVQLIEQFVAVEDEAETRQALCGVRNLMSRFSKPPQALKLSTW